MWPFALEGIPEPINCHYKCVSDGLGQRGIPREVLDLLLLSEELFLQSTVCGQTLVLPSLWGPQQSCLAQQGYVPAEQIKPLPLK